MKYLMIALMMVSTAASADYLTKDTGEVCSIPEGYNTAPYDTDFNLKGMREECEFPHVAFTVAFVKAIENLKETGLEHPICTSQLSFGGPPVRPCYQLIED